MRSIAEKLKSPAPAQLPEAGKRSEDVFSLKLETPMYGGGVVAGEVDTDRPVRVPSVRGNLRFWWRTLFAGDKKGEKLREAENAIWGSTATPSRVSVSVECEPWSRLRKHDAADPFGFKKFGAEAYALFPAAPQNQKGHDILEEKMPFTLRLTYSETLEQDKITEVRAAFAAWVYFGGLGARTRRGLGTLSCEKADLSGGGKLPGLKEILSKNTKVTLWRLIPPAAAGMNAMSAWNKALKSYQDYRQFRTRKYGRSLWPEADSLRKITGCANKVPQHDHSAPIVPDNLIPSFPRASLGLPIIYHFKDEPQQPGRLSPEAIRQSDPEQVQVFPETKKREEKKKDSGRMASPIITKALFDSGQWYPAVIILPRESALNVKLRAVIGKEERKKELSLPEGVLKQQDVRYGKLKPMSGSSDAISGFENFIRDKGFKEEVCA